MKLILSPLVGVLDCYGTEATPLPARMSFLHPEAKASWLKLEQQIGLKLRVSDMWRSAEGSLEARRRKTGVQRPGYSAHNYGLAVDLDWIDCAKRLKVSKEGLDQWMARAGWYCHRRDHRADFEAWHFNFLGDATTAAGYLQHGAATNTAGAIEAKIQDLYGAGLKLSRVEVWEHLKRLGYLTKEGAEGPAVAAFQRDWSLEVDGRAGPITQRTLAFVGATREIVP